MFQPENQNSQTPHFSFSSIFNPSIKNVSLNFLPFLTQFSTSRHNLSGIGGSSNPSSQTPIQSNFANPHGLDAIDLNDDDIVDRRQDISTDPIVGTDQKGETFWSRIHSYCYKINKVVAQFAGCYDQASRNIRSGLNADDTKELAYKLYSTNYGQKFTFERHSNMLRLE
ncbi:hypothetical protein Ahy_A06g029660 isoform B [Arachis hypogaea]|uniref:Uncharacterized protein n=1 Tax=Arachis hypogaea TaxID=3818 RepID=A0A445CTZ3_ARAHY|nr:hypothetical protein Ahy_A06g029660 isoform B [Arachis hypogaea]